MVEEKKKFINDVNEIKNNTVPFKFGAVGCGEITIIYPDVDQPLSGIEFSLAELTDDFIADVEITNVGRIDIYRFRKGVDVAWNAIITAGVPAGTGLGTINYSYDFPVADWAIGDLVQVHMSGIQVTVNGNVFTIPRKTIYGVVGVNQLVTMVEAMKLVVDTNLDQTISGTQTAIENAITAAEESIKGTSDKDLTEVEGDIATLQIAVDDIPAEGNSKDFNSTEKTYLTALIAGLSSIRKTTYTTVSGIAVPYPNDGTWATIKTVTVAKDTIFNGIKITNSDGFPVNPIFRITYNGITDDKKVYPFGSGIEVESGVMEEFRKDFIVEEPDTYYIQVACDVGGADGASATLTQLDIIELG